MKRGYGNIPGYIIPAAIVTGVVSLFLKRTSVVYSILFIVLATIVVFVIQFQANMMSSIKKADKDKSGTKIPKSIERINRFLRTKPKIPSCPECGSPVKLLKDGDKVRFLCTNKNCRRSSDGQPGK